MYDTSASLNINTFLIEIMKSAPNPKELLLRLDEVIEEYSHD